jgi:hypothetical protein
MDALLRLTEQKRFVQLPDADDGIFFSQRRQHWQMGMKGEAGTPIKNSWFLKHRHAYPSIATP